MKPQLLVVPLLTTCLVVIVMNKDPILRLSNLLLSRTTLVNIAKYIHPASHVYNALVNTGDKCIPIDTDYFQKRL